MFPCCHVCGIPRVADSFEDTSQASQTHMLRRWGKQAIPSTRVSLRKHKCCIVSLVTFHDFQHASRHIWVCIAHQVISLVLGPEVYFDGYSDAMQSFLDALCRNREVSPYPQEAGCPCAYTWWGMVVPLYIENHESTSVPLAVYSSIGALSRCVLLHVCLCWCRHVHVHIQIACCMAVRVLDRVRSRRASFPSNILCL